MAKSEVTMVWMTHIVLMCVLAGMVRTEIYTSSYQVQQLATREEELVEVIEKYLSIEQTRLNELKAFIQNAKRNLTKNTLRHSPSTDDPISALLILKRFESEWSPQIMELRKQANLKQTLNTVLKLIPNFPTMTDVDGATSGIVRLQETYNISAARLKNRSSNFVTSSNCFQLAEASFQRGVQTIAAEWLTEALLIKHPGPEWAAARKGMVDTLMASAIATRRQRTIDKCGHGEKAIPKTSSRVNASKSTESVNSVDGRCGKLEEGASAEEEAFFRLCRGGQEAVTTGSMCTYSPSAIPYKRWKQEVLSQDPYITVFHDVISSPELNHLKNISLHLLERSSVGQPGKGVVADARTSKVAWLWDNHTNIVQDLSRRVAEITGLCTEYRDRGSCAEPLQVLNYGIGGQYRSHHDFYPNKSVVEKTASYVRDSGDRLATFMFYLSDVSEGGATVFPEIGVRIPPIKGSAAFWYNFKNGKRDWRTKHGGCPVLKGHKWVANKWIHEIAGFG